jgi:type I restriction enzyme S subunit
MKKYTSYKPSGIEWIGDVPEHWVITKLNRYVFFQEGPGLRTFQFTDDGIKVICVTNITEKGIDFSYKKFISEQEYIDKYQHFRVNKGDLLLSSSGNSWGKVSEYLEEEEVILNTSTIRLNTLDSNRFTKNLIKYVLKSEFVRIQLDILMTGSCQPNFGPTHLDQIIIPIPSIDEQHQIVHFLDEKTEIIDKLISTKERKIDLLKEQRISLINQVITKGLDLNVKMKDSGVEWIGEIPEHWGKRRVSNFGVFFKGSGIKKDEVKEEGFPCIRYGEIYTKYNRVVYEPISFIDEETSKNSVMIKKGDVLFTGSGETMEDIGKTIVYYGEKDVFVGGDIIVLRLYDGLNPLYMSYLMNTNFVQYQKSLSGKGEIIVHIYSKNIKEIITPLPPQNEQQQIVEYLDNRTKEIDDLMSLEQKKIEVLKEYRQSLISEVITGKIDVRTNVN